jgi:hypothetical protein
MGTEEAEKVEGNLRKSLIINEIFFFVNRLCELNTQTSCSMRKLSGGWSGLSSLALSGLRWPAAEQVAEEFAPAVEPGGVSPQQPLHAEAQVGPRCFNNQVKVVAHEAVSMDLPAGALADLAQCLEEELAVFVVVKNVVAMISPVHQVIDRIFVFDAQFARHGAEGGVQTKTRQYSSLIDIKGF